MYTCQWLLHSAYWFVSRGKYLESWHVLSAAAREAWDLGLHRQSAFEGLPEFDREMRRRTWCIIQSLDWQISSHLSRQTVINWSEVDVAFPVLTLEGLDLSPILHLRLQSELMTALASVYVGPVKVVTPSQVRKYVSTIEDWIQSLPTVYGFEHADTSVNRNHPWVTSNRFHLHHIIRSMVISSVRPFMVRRLTAPSANEILQLRDKGVEYCLKSLQANAQWVEHISHQGGTLQFLIFSIVKAVFLLHTVIIKNEDRTISRDAEIHTEIDKGMKLLARLYHTSPAAKKAHDMLSAKVTRQVLRPGISYQRTEDTKESSCNTPDRMTLPQYSRSVAPRET